MHRLRDKLPRLIGAVLLAECRFISSSSPMLRVLRLLENRRPVVAKSYE
jgi:hypothetical protein